MKVLVTGADGMLGSHICRELISRGYRVKALIQPGRFIGTLEDLSLEEVAGDLLNYDDLLVALQDAQAVIHAAASTQIWPTRAKHIWDVNLKGTKLLAQAALVNKIEKFVHIGTANSFAPGTKDKPGTEEDDRLGITYNLDYQESKRAAQDYLLDHATKAGLPVCVINPGFMFGAYDSKPGSGAMVVSMASGSLVGYTSGGRSYVAARDVATCVVNALTKGKIGECYLAVGKNLDYGEIFRLIAETIGVEAPRRRIPGFLIEAIGMAGSIWGKLTNNIPPISYPMARLAHTDCYYSNAKAVRELEMPQSPLQDAILECYSWLNDHGYL